MKQLYTTIITLFLSTLCLSAQHIHFTDTSNLWTIYTDDFTEETGYSYWDTYTLLRDTVYEGEAGYMPYSYEGDEIPAIYDRVFITEDTLAKKVYAREISGEDTIPFVLYDFSMEVGDTLHFPFTWYADHVCDTVYPDVLINGIPHRAFHIYEGCHQGGYDVIEGIGSLRGPLYPYTGCWERTVFTLSCFKHNDEEPVFSHLFANDCYLSITDTKKSEPNITLFPNPAYGQLHISVQQAGFGFRCSVYDILGRQVYRGTLKDQLTLDIATWQSGVYLLRVTDDRGSFAIKRFSKF